MRSSVPALLLLHAFGCGAAADWDDLDSYLASKGKLRKPAAAAAPKRASTDSRRLQHRLDPQGSRSAHRETECEDRKFPRTILVVAPPLYGEPARDVTGMYQVDGRHEGAPLYRSKGCAASGRCVMYTDGRSWRISHLEDAHSRNAAILRSGDPLTSCKLLQQALHGQGIDPPRRWELLTNAGVWASDDRLGIRVGTRDLLAGEGLDWTEVLREQARLAASAPGQERRLDKDGRRYTKGEFISFHGDQWEAEWDEARDRTPSPPRTPEPAEEHQYVRGEAVVATTNIVLGGVLAARKGSPGVVMGPAGRRHPNGRHTNYMVRFMGEFAQAIIINTKIEQIKPSGAIVGQGDVQPSQD
eukprot:TRINITY_DN21038_c0_g1_i1.p1 TRINITY_DN21038_c0_g1~~TRINITY_DN21038_c0_g1_i1.p1  ORF type:complete len:357 (+),score=103.12 TRINITY_DN21038_c0_g1_i1:52-1122(+)